MWSFRPRQRDENGRCTEQDPPTTKPLVEARLPPFELTTPIYGKPTLEELEEKTTVRTKVNTC